MSRTFRERLRRSSHYRDKDGVPTWKKHVDSVETYQLDMTDALDSGETISSATWEGDGVTIDSSSLATPVASVTVSGTDGEATATLVTSASRTLIRRLRFASPLVAEDDYRHYP